MVKPVRKERRARKASSIVQEVISITYRGPNRGSLPKPSNARIVSGLFCDGSSFLNHSPTGQPLLAIGLGAIQQGFQCREDHHKVFIHWNDQRFKEFGLEITQSPQRDFLK